MTKEVLGKGSEMILYCLIFHQKAITIVTWMGETINSQVIIQWTEKANKTFIQMSYLIKS